MAKIDKFSKSTFQHTESRNHAVGGDYGENREEMVNNWGNLEREDIQDTIGNQIRWVMHNLPAEYMDYDTNFEGNRISFEVNSSQ